MCYEYEISTQEKLRKSKQQVEDLKKHAKAEKPAPEKDSGKKPQTQEEPVPA
ncbi:MAG TPA: hypothetical protein VK460_08620 [Burkholderiales bacterium]|nr:hypothetical protein [Burkholderiales bacterium]